MFGPREVYPENHMSVRRFLVNLLIEGDKQLIISYQILIQSTPLSVRYSPKGLTHLSLVVRKPLLDIHKQSALTVGPGLGKG